MDGGATPPSSTKSALTSVFLGGELGSTGNLRLVENRRHYVTVQKLINDNDVYQMAA